jgi:hypothetical protein
MWGVIDGNLRGFDRHRWRDIWRIDWRNYVSLKSLLCKYFLEKQQRSLSRFGGLIGELVGVLAGGPARRSALEDTPGVTNYRSAAPA